MPNTGPDAPWTALIVRVEGLLTRLEAFIPPAPAPIDFKAPAYRWRVKNQRGWLEPVHRIPDIRLDDLKHVERQREAIVRNTRQFLSGRPANNVLLTGARGTGKSSLIKACLQQFHGQGLRLIEVEKEHLVDLPDIVAAIGDRPERFILFCDDLSFEEGDSGYKALKVALDGSIASGAENLLIYATSNRRHLLPEHMTDNETVRHQPDGEIHPGEVIEEKISLSERFGLWLSFYPFRQDEYLTIVDQWIKRLGQGADAGDWRSAALQWALERGSRSGRVAYQFARDWVGGLVQGDHDAH